MISIVVATSLNWVIGHQGKTPWRLPSDIKRFKELTTGGTVIMGRKTYESLPPRFRPLPDRLNIVLTRSTLWQPDNDEVVACASWDEAKHLVDGDEKVFVMGGVEIYALALADPEVKKIHLTVVMVECQGDTFLLPIDRRLWSLEYSEPPQKSAGDEYLSRYEVRYR
ncbi:MAG: diacylglycerol kinase [Candidatus Vogelbacteria bacterium CG10_big_fil_rev_8_21_14_0_10_49_38]|uniref:dihydrofolate reductase n=1 Tax=Candidatus Vogelbacteria bacterium CG10_big_fil_rev_8_21_14_0_10_49_38 TaxID=1975043 RepID=A0A2H0RIG0_9BACT|nr:MAG: hypothetical protein BK006_00745 [bacterium CG10_49_38]PIR46278.1 MAG: diacylglycerol kinase [Candidatus Vogelbacteria bacterium CG10_big_fil_rev_8_21_14_0_10_49_38]